MIAEAINARLVYEPALIAGMGMRQWPPGKIAKAIKLYRATLNGIEEAA